MRQRFVEGLVGAGGLLRVRALIALAMVIGGLALLGLGLVDPVVALTLIFSGSGAYGIQRAAKGA